MSRIISCDICGRELLPECDTLILSGEEDISRDEEPSQFVRKDFINMDFCSDCRRIMKDEINRIYRELLKKRRK